MGGTQGAAPGEIIIPGVGWVHDGGEYLSSNLRSDVKLVILKSMHMHIFKFFSPLLM